MSQSLWSLSSLSSLTSSSSSSSSPASSSVSLQHQHCSRHCHCHCPCHLCCHDHNGAVITIVIFNVITVTILSVVIVTIIALFVIIIIVLLKIIDVLLLSSCVKPNGVFLSFHRARFESLCFSLFQQSLSAIDRVLTTSNLTKDNVDQVRPRWQIM